MKKNFFKTICVAMVMVIVGMMCVGCGRDISSASQPNPEPPSYGEKEPDKNAVVGCSCTSCSKEQDELGYELGYELCGIKFSIGCEAMRNGWYDRSEWYNALVNWRRDGGEWSSYIGYWSAINGGTFDVVRMLDTVDCWNNIFGIQFPIQAAKYNEQFFIDNSLILYTFSRSQKGSQTRVSKVSLSDENEIVVESVITGFMGSGVDAIGLGTIILEVAKSDIAGVNGMQIIAEIKS